MSFWSRDEESLLNKIHEGRHQKVIDEVKQRFRIELSKSLGSFIGKTNTALTQRTINYLVDRMRQRYQQELTDRGIDYELKVTLNNEQPNR